ncbi:hypothetical protein ASU31_23035 [Pedobacter ginsenosidimutans]|uniref:DUF5977 domain-containing protein n=1 Tax=Pedobacter ginsenosidimutans TaxID=687842 RepID=A0A0T5VIM0_9SPHI|nr:DUF5977 domain-containing protein [Pedobacter ginsenosidimutans]KRT13714.1 hypothetical protein ASU31_23035 [Pedobacter ginsenosidimutans]
MANTGYVGYSTLEQYIISNGSATGVTKPNISSDEDYIGPVKDESVCPPQQRFYNSEVIVYGTKTDCPPGYAGSTVGLVVPAGQFASTISQDDANNQAFNYGNSVKESYANAVGTCAISYLVINTDNLLAFQTSSYNDACAIPMAGGNLYRYGGAAGTVQIGDPVFSNSSGSPADLGYYSFNLDGNRIWIRVQLNFNDGITFVSEMGTCVYQQDNFISSANVTSTIAYFNASENVASNLVIEFFWQDDLGRVGYGSVNMYQGQNFADWYLTNGGYISTLEIRGIFPSSDGVFKYIF